MSYEISLNNLHKWCCLSREVLEDHPDRKVPFLQVQDSTEMGFCMANTLLDEIKENNEKGNPTRAILPCGPRCWYEP